MNDSVMYRLDRPSFDGSLSYQFSQQLCISQNEKQSCLEIKNDFSS
jgi:hypothetical protein